MKKKYMYVAFLATLFSCYASFAQCAQVAPYSIDFDTAAGGVPACWTENTGDEDWDFRNTGTGHIGDGGTLVGSTASGGYFAWVDDSYTSGTEQAILESPSVDISSLTTPALKFYWVSFDEGASGSSTLTVEVYDGSTWGVLSTFSGNTGASDGEWVQETLDLSAYTGSIQVRFIVEDSGSFYDDIAIDDIAIENGPTCYKPANMVSSNVTSTSADVSWSSAAASFDIEYGVSGFTPSGTANFTGVASTSYSFSGLSPVTSYDVYVRSDCGGGDLSSWAGPITFETACTVFMAPWAEDFSSSSIPSCWEEYGDDSWKFSLGAAYAASNAGDHTVGGGTNYAWVDGSYNTNGEETTLVSPFVDVSGLTRGVALEFYVYSNNTNDAAVNELEVEYYDGSNWNSVMVLNTILGDDWVRYILDLTAYPVTGDVRVRFTNTAENGAGSGYYNDILIDDVSIFEKPACIDPGSIVASNFTQTTADVSWVDYDASATSWNIEYGVVGFSQGSGTMVTATTNPYTITGLTPGGGYEFYLQSDCGGGDVSVWMGPYSFETLLAGATCETALSISALPYSTSDDTVNYQNNYTGAVGTGCGSTENYLNGYETVYEYTATADVEVDILMSNLSGFYAGVFVYEDCVDVGVSCSGGAVAGPTDDDFGIYDFQMMSGTTYYIVVSSWLNPSFSYDLDIIPFDCNTLSGPNADANQDFIAGDTVSDLSVTTTEATATVNWYSDAAGTNPITDPATTSLVDSTTYWVSQTYNGCESPLVPVSVSEIDCSLVSVTSVVDGTVTCSGQVTLQANVSGNGDEVYWYDAATGGNLVGVGSSFVTPDITQTTSYWASEVTTSQGASSGGALPGAYCVPTSPSIGCSSNDDINDFVLTEANSGTTLISHLGTGCSSSGYYTDYTSDSSLTANLFLGESYDFNITHTYLYSQYVKIWIDLDRSGTFTYDELMFSSSVSSSSGVLGETSGSFTIPQTALAGATGMRVMNRYGSNPYSNCDPQGTFGETHDYKVIIGGDVICESPRVEVVATVNQTGDVNLDYTDLNYTDTNSTAAFGNNFSGDAGSSCEGASILDGNDVVYQYTADATNDDILTIELTGITNPDTGLFLYDSCGDIGVSCVEGLTNDGSTSISIEDYYVNAGDVIYIVVSSSSNTVNYTLNIYGFDCNAVPLPEPESLTPIFISGDVLGDVEVEQNINSTGLNWYYDAAGTMPIVDPTTETLVDGTMYYVTQTILGCESVPLAVSPDEFFCSSLDIVGDPSTTICTPGGQVDLTVQAGGQGSEVYWYDAATGGNIINLGTTYSTTVSTTTSFWVSEVFIDGVSSTSGHAKPAPTGGGSFGSTYGVIFNAYQAFDLVSVEVYPNITSSASVDIELIDESTGNVVNTATVTVPSGDGTVAATVPLNFNIQPGQYRLIQSSSVSMYRDYSGNAFPYNIGVAGSVGSVTSGAFGTTGTSTYYYYFYNWTISQGQIVCESTPQEVVVTVNDNIPNEPTGNSNQEFCEGATIADLAVSLSSVDSEVVWYDDSSGYNELSMNTDLEDGLTYYASELLDTCESNTRLAVTVEITEQAPLPTGASNQGVTLGDFVSDFVVLGANLTWYYDQYGLQPIADPTTVVVQDQVTYYVSQSPVDYCESELLAVTAHISLGSDDPVFSNLVYYPNPAVNYVVIENTIPINKVEIFNLLGQKVFSKKLNDSKLTVNTTSFASGTYMVKVEVDNKVAVYKLLKD